jgi:hypothetical protein
MEFRPDKGALKVNAKIDTNAQPAIETDYRVASNGDCSNFEGLLVSRPGSNSPWYDVTMSSSSKPE